MSELLIKGENIIITKMDMSMAEDVWQNSLDEDNRRFVPDEVFETLDDAKEVVQSLIDCYESEDGPFVYAILRKEDNANLGYVQLVQIEEGWEIGYHIAKRYTGHGYATEAVNLFLQYLKNNTKIKEVYGVALSDNLASRRVLQKCGFKIYFEGEGPYQGKNKNIIESVIKL